MKVLDLSFMNFRNLKDSHIVPCENVNIICGNNAQGKTNLLEAVWLFTGGRSFRRVKESHMVTFEKEHAELTLDFYAREREQKAVLKILQNKRTATLNGVERGPATAIIGNFCTVIFSPTHLNLVKGGPSERRKFIDAAICQMKISYPTLLAKYQHTLKQRNALLRDVKYNAGLIDTLDVWDYKLSALGAAIVKQRLKYVNIISNISREVYDGISSGKETLDIKYDSSYNDKDYTEKELSELIFTRLRKKQEQDLSNGVTSVGPHRDDIDIEIDKKSARVYSSQGQQRSCVLSLKLAEAELLKKENDEAPVVLLDDVMSELDPGRQSYILNSIKDTQVFITCCEPETLLRLTKGKVFKVDNGIIKDNM